MIATSQLAKAFQKLADLFPKTDWFSRERLRQVLAEAVYGPAFRKLREEERDADLIATPLGPVVVQNILNGPDEPNPK